MKLKSWILYSLKVLVLFGGTFFQTSAQTARVGSYVSANTFITNPITDTLVPLTYRTERERPVFLLGSGVLIGYGLISLGNNGVRQLNNEAREEIREHNLRRNKLDNYTQYFPTLMVYGLNATGVKGLHNFVDRSLIYGTSQLIAASFVLPLKHIVGEERPDGSNRLSFPSGHTTTAFSSAHFMYREYRDNNLWLSLSGYPFAIFTGAYRAVNDRHWLGDVVAGAGFGILSTELSYLLYPKINKFLSNGKKRRSHIMVFPQYQQNMLGVGCIANF
ncbi:phosphatase PAP2 family protein [Sphingobacterium sp. lm-10]|uniref:phosphatase PAP2 family protein n=1 Tax=Sphingobacterium sp. lm-10 TaxID=2944904 RepID=UPI00201FD7EE|nr:phosphatase PAP2 family protein [Sphingobacterium sp. lm-10]MCL7989069.1 phosphatase PAP2 family protein [Sphingobacterium sp. lm-10]